MTTRRKLFDKPMKELREAFVRARFAQEDVFGRANVERWLDNQRETERPHKETWLRFLDRASVQPWADRDFFDLRTHATSVGVLNEQFGSVGMADDYGPIYDRLAFDDNLEGNDLYWGTYGQLYVADHIYGPMFVISERQSGITIKRIRSRDTNPGALCILGVVFAEWNQGRPKWKEARLSLCTAFADEIAKERTKAEHDFDTAVAVSADGTKIVHADWVVVFIREDNRRRDHFIVFPASVFRKQKMLRPNENRFERINESSILRVIGNSHNIATLETRKAIGEVAGFACYYYRISHNDCSADMMCYGDFRRHEEIEEKIKRIVVVSRSLYPSPLPDGGVEVTV